MTVLPVNCEQLKKEDISRILELVLKEFPVTEVDFFIPRWMEMLPPSHWMKEQIVNACRHFMGNVRRMKDIPTSWREEECEVLDRIDLGKMNLSDGTVTVQVNPADGYYYQVLSDFSGLDIQDEYQLMHHLKEFSSMRKEYQKVLNALVQVRMKGYGVVTPDRSEIVLDEPTVIRHGNKYGVKMRAEAPSLNLIKAHIQTEIAPIVGSEQQAEDLIAYMKENARNKEGGIWETNIFGKSIEQIVEDGIQAKVNQMTEDCQLKLQDALQKIINDSNGGMICIII